MNYGVSPPLTLSLRALPHSLCSSLPCTCTPLLILQLYPTAVTYLKQIFHNRNNNLHTPTLQSLKTREISLTWDFLSKMLLMQADRNTDRNYTNKIAKTRRSHFQACWVSHGRQLSMGLLSVTRITLEQITPSPLSPRT
jgi:hypothetical protein